MKLNLACGRSYKPGWFNVDISGEVKTDEVRNLLKFPWPYENVEEIFCSHFVEHIGDEFIPFMDECHRILKPGGVFHIVAPYYTSIRCWQDPTHKRAISEFTFSYFSAKEREKLGVSHYGIKSNFDLIEFRYHYPEEAKHLSDDERSFMRVHSWNTVADIEVLLRKHDTDKQGLDRQANSLVPN